MNAPCISFHRLAFRAALEEGLWNNYAVNKARHDTDVCFHVYFSKIPATSDLRVRCNNDPLCAACLLKYFQTALHKPASTGMTALFLCKSRLLAH